MLEVRNLSMAYGKKTILQDISFTLERGELLGVLGVNGCGKSTLLRALCGVSPFEGGEVLLDNSSISTYRDLSQRIAYLDQQPDAAWAMRVYDVIALGRLPYGTLSQGDAEQIEAAMCDADVLHLQQRPITELSVGERSRVCLARALAVGAEAMLVDEPTAGLDPAHKLHVMSMLQRKAAEGMAIACVLHDVTLAAQFCNRLLLLGEQTVLAYGTPEMVLTNENLHRCLGIETIHMHHEGYKLIVPWRKSLFRTAH